MPITRAGSVALFICHVLFFGSAWHAHTAPIQYEVIVNADGGAQKYMDDWIDLSLEGYREYPYLYEGTRESEAEYFAFYSRQPRLVMVVAKHNVDKRIIGVLAGMPLAEERDNKTKPFANAGENPADYFYIAECVVAAAFRSQGIARTMYELFEQYVHELQPPYRYLTVCGIEREVNPEWYIPEQHNPLYVLAPRYGWERYPTVQSCFYWQDVGSEVETGHTMVFWRKELLQN